MKVGRQDVDKLLEGTVADQPRGSGIPKSLFLREPTKSAVGIFSVSDTLSCCPGKIPKLERPQLD
jgi:hypothetical protein